MSSNYPEGSMRGSGIYAQEIELDRYCDTCEKEVSLVFMTDDWGHNATATCECGAEFEEEIPERDEDADYDDWRDSQYED
jgi:transcription elongation factor Elf1